VLILASANFFVYLALLYSTSQHFVQLQ